MRFCLSLSRLSWVRESAFLQYNCHKMDPGPSSSEPIGGLNLDPIILEKENHLSLGSEVSQISLNKDQVLDQKCWKYPVKWQFPAQGLET